MTSSPWRHDPLHRWGEAATHPGEPRCSTLAALQLLAMPQGIAAVVRLASAAHRGPLGRVQLPFPDSIGMRVAVRPPRDGAARGSELA